MVGDNCTPSPDIECLRKGLQKGFKLFKFVIDHNSDNLEDDSYFFLIEMMGEKKVFELESSFESRLSSLFTDELSKIFCGFRRKISVFLK